jgi:lysophospholipase L1-like esterase
MRAVATAHVSGVLATIMSYEGENLYGGTPDKVYDRLQANLRPGILTGIPEMPESVWSSSLNVFLNSGIENPNRRDQDPYHGIPKDEVKGTCKVELEQIWLCTSPSSGYVNLQISDPRGKSIYSTYGVSTRTPGVPVNTEDELKIQEPGMMYTMGMRLNVGLERVTFRYGSDVGFVAKASGGDCTLQGEDWDTTCPLGSTQKRRFVCEYACECPKEGCEDSSPVGPVLSYRKTDAGLPVKDGIKLRILPVGDSITAGAGDGYRGPLRERLSENKVVFAGTRKSGTMDDGYHCAFPGRTIKYISDRVGPSLDQRPNVILFAAGTNDMSSNLVTGATEGNDPQEAVERYGAAVDKMVKECPDATVLVAIIIPTNVTDKSKVNRTRDFQKLIPGMVRSRFDAGHKVLAADFSTFSLTNLDPDQIHPSGNGYKVMGDWWYSFIHQIPEAWLQEPMGPDPDPNRESIPDSGPEPDLDDIDASKNGGLAENIPEPDWGGTPVRTLDKDTVKKAVDIVKDGEKKGFACKIEKDISKPPGLKPIWQQTGKIVQGGVGSSGDFMYESHWQQVLDVAEGIHRDGKYVRFHDMDGDGKAGKYSKFFHAT